MQLKHTITEVIFKIYNCFVNGSEKRVAPRLTQRKIMNSSTEIVQCLFILNLPYTLYDQHLVSCEWSVRIKLTLRLRDECNKIFLLIVLFVFLINFTTPFEVLSYVLLRLLLMPTDFLCTGGCNSRTNYHICT